MTVILYPGSRITPLLLIGVVLGSIIVGAATPTEAAGVALSARCVWQPTNQRSIWKRLKTLRAPPWQPPAWCS